MKFFLKSILVVTFAISFFKIYEGWSQQNTSSSHQQSERCWVDEVGELENRFHIACDTSDGTSFRYFAMENSDARKTDFLRLARRAYDRQGYLSVSYDASDRTGASFGCLNNDCRKIINLEPLTGQGRLDCPSDNLTLEVYDDSFFISCSSSIWGRSIGTFAARLPEAAQTLRLIRALKQVHGDVRIHFDPWDVSMNELDCYTDHCRKIESIENPFSD